MSTKCASQGRRAPPRAGVAALELALALPLLITIVLGCVDFGRFAYTFITISNAAREGAWFGSMESGYGDWQEVATEVVLREMGLTSAEMSERGIVVTASELAAPENGTLARVRVEVQYPFHTVVNWPLLPSEVTLTRASVFTIQVF